MMPVAIWNLNKISIVKYHYACKNRSVKYNPEYFPASSGMAEGQVWFWKYL